MAPNLMRRALALLPSSPSSQLFLYMTLLETIVDVVIVTILLKSFEGKIIDTVLERNESSVLPVYLGLFVLAHLVQLVLAFDSIVAKNTIQVVALIVFNTLFLVYSIIQILEVRDLLASGTLRTLVWLIPVMISITEATYAVTFYWIFTDFGWQVFKKIGADRGIKKAYATYQIFLCILKFDTFFFVAFSLQLVLLVLQQNDTERWLTVAALPVTLIILMMGYFGVRRENKALFWSFFIGCIAGAAYFIYKLITIYQGRSTDYLLVFKSLTVFAALCFAALLATLIVSLGCYRNFNRGLRYHLMKEQPLKLDPEDEDYDAELERYKGNRMSID